jgi:hypothetical protein
MKTPNTMDTSSFKVETGKDSTKDLAFTPTQFNRSADQDDSNMKCDE